MLAGLEASIDGPTLFSGSTGACCGGSVGGGELPSRGGDGQGQRRQRGEVVTAGPRGRQSGGATGGRQTALCAGRRTELAAQAIVRTARRDLAGAVGGTGGPRDQGELLRGLALLRA